MLDDTGILYIYILETKEESKSQKKYYIEWMDLFKGRNKKPGSLASRY